MCGIAGIFGPDLGQMLPFLPLMADSLKHRGPDASGTWADISTGIGFAHRRLAVIDLSPLGNQPMVSDSGRFVLSYNGEIYNYRDLRHELQSFRAIPWRGHSDTEVLLNAIECWGVRQSLERINGMFAFAAWDRDRRTLTLARDRMGEKPLYIGWIGSYLVFASELRAFRCLPHCDFEVDRQALGLLLRFGYIPAPFSIYRNIFKLPAATSLTLAGGPGPKPSSGSAFLAKLECYWDLSRAAGENASRLFCGNEKRALDVLQDLLEDAVRLRMEADVPLGALLSGGIDSSLVSAIMQRHSAKPIQTFTIGFDENKFNEAKYAKRIAEYLGTEHTELYLSSEHALGIIPRLPEIYDEPFADPSQIPTFLVSSIARRHVTVAVSGDGGDELFCGYGRYFDASRLWKGIGWWPGIGREILARLLQCVGKMLDDKGRIGFRLHRLGSRIDAEAFEEYYANLLSFSLLPIDRGFWPKGDAIESLSHPLPSGLEISRRMMFLDQSLYLPENILTKTDRASMRSSLEVRVPLLDHRVVEFSWRLPTGLHTNNRSGKLLLKKLLYKYIPCEFVDRPKQGFEIPLNDWLRGPLSEWVCDLLEPSVIAGQGYLDAEKVSTLVKEHLGGHADHGYALWPVLMFQTWLNHYA